ncbi:MAG: hypothetical protein U7123_09600 [Potamolinea sp.]
MLLVNRSTSSQSSPVRTLAAQNSRLQEQETTPNRLSMIWVQEFDGTRYRLVARWVHEV